MISGLLYLAALSAHNGAPVPWKMRFPEEVTLGKPSLLHRCLITALSSATDPEKGDIYNVHL